MADVKWIKIVTDVFDDEKILLIETLPDADSIIVIWFKLLCLAGKQNNGGVFLMGGRIPYTEEMFATIFRRPLNTVRLALRTFQEYGMVDIIDNTVTIPHWEKHQSLDAYEQSKEKTRLRVAAHRERQKSLIESNVTSNVTDGVTVTDGNATDKKRIEENRRDKKREDKKESTHDLYIRLIPDYIIPDNLKLKLCDWFAYKTERKEPYKEQGMKSLLRQIENNQLTYGEKAVCDLIDDSMANGWKGIIFDRLKQKAPVRQSYTQPKSSSFLDLVDDYD
jgi:predicted phage replisome organizer